MNFENKKAIYLQIADYVCEQILLRKWSASEKIPSVRELAATIAVNPNTIMRTYAYLEEKHIIVTQRGIGYFVADNGYDSVLTLKKEAFLENDLPHLFHAMEMLHISMDHVKQLYQLRKIHENK